MSKNVKIWAIRTGLLVLPFIAMAASLDTVMSKFMDLLKWAIQALFVIVTFYFFWGVIQYVMAGGEDAKIKLGRDHMLWGLIGMAVMLAAWGIVRAAIAYFGLGGDSNIPTGLQ